jgi:hypothetical protein
VIPENQKRHEAKSMAYTVKQLAVMSGVIVRTGLPALNRGHKFVRKLAQGIVQSSDTCAR